MRDVLGPLLEWYDRGEPVGLATVVRTFHSAPREPGAAMAVSAARVVGSVSGGCVEGAVYDVAQDVVADGAPRLEEYGISEGDAFAVGLTCGGILHVFVEPVTRETFPELPEIAASMRAGEPVALATAIAGPGQVGAHLAIWADRFAGTLGSARLDAAVVDDARGMLEQGVTDERRYGPEGERRLDDRSVFIQSFAPPPTMYVFGAIDFAAAVARVGKFLGYRVTVCDARPVFATRERFPEADEVWVDWPHRFLESRPVDARTVICILTHDPKFDVPLLQVALRRPAAYIGAMGSRRTHAERTGQLRALGVAEADLKRIASPVGLDIGARTPEETAVSIAAELVALRWGGTGARLSDTTGRIHHERDHHEHDRPERDHHEHDHHESDHHERDHPERDHPERDQS